jgi:hypothetical protein
MTKLHTKRGQEEKTGMWGHGLPRITMKRRRRKERKHYRKNKDRGKDNGVYRLKS